MSTYGSSKRLSSFMTLLLLALSKSVLAELSLQQLQAIASFPQSCMAAYGNPILACLDASTFSVTGHPSICSTDCFAALTQATKSIQQACGGVSAPPGTIIAHAFSGDLPTFLCTVSSSGTPSVPKTTSTIQSQSASASSAKPTSNVSPSTSSKVSTSISVSTTSINSSTGSTLVTSTSSSVSSSSTTASQMSSTSSESLGSSVTASPSSSSQSSSSAAAQRTLQPGGGGSPFDQVVLNAAPTRGTRQNMLPLVVGIAFAVVL